MAMFFVTQFAMTVALLQLPMAIGGHFGVNVQSTMSTLNQYTFNGNVLQGAGDLVEHWVVLFCTDWFEPCEDIQTLYSDLSSHWQEKLNSASLLTSSVRFVKVDCAVDKELCNSQNVESYPTVAHYFQNQQLSLWAGGTVADLKRLPGWIQTQLVVKDQIPAKSHEASSSWPWTSKATIEELIGIVAGSMVIVAMAAGSTLLIAHDLGFLTSSPSHDARLQEKAEQQAVSQQAHRAHEMQQKPSQTTSHRFLPADWANERCTIEL